MNYEQFAQKLKALNKAPVRKDVLERVLRGQTDDEIAQERKIHKGTVRKHISTVYELFSIKGRSETDHSSRREELIALFAKYKPEWVGERVKKRGLPTPTYKITSLNGVVPLDSPLYLEREADRVCQEHLVADRTAVGRLPFIRIKGSKGMGKSSLLVRLRDSEEVKKRQVVGFVDLGSSAFEPKAFSNLNKLLYQFTYAVTQAFKDKLKPYNPPDLKDFWREDLAPGVNCTNYLKQHIFSQIKQSKTLLIDGIDAVLGQEKTQNPFLNLLRTWNETEMKKVSDAPIIWSSLVIAYSTEPYPEYDIKSSVMQNVGIEVELPEFSAEEVLVLAKRYDLSWSLEDVQFLMNFIGGHPDLVNIVLYKISQENFKLSDIPYQVKCPDGIFYNYLMKKYEKIENNEKLISCLKKILNGEICKDQFSIFQLEKMGLVKPNNSQVEIGCELYQKYFEAVLSSS